MEGGDGENYQNKPRCYHAAPWTRTLLPESERLAPLVDGLEKDLPPGEHLVALFRPFLEHLAASNLSPKTIQKHVDNTWVLGGEIITELNYTPSLRKAPVEKILADMIKDGGPILHHGDSEEQQRSFESTCRKLWRFLNPSRG